MLRIAVVDDDEFICIQMKKALLQASKKFIEYYDVDSFCFGGELKNKLLKEKYNILFLDIELEDCTGINIGKFIRDDLQDDSTQIVFVSGKDGYDRQLFEFRPLAFIEKPVSSSKVIHVLEKYIRVYSKSEDYFMYRFGRDSFKIQLKDILYFKSISKQIIVKTNDHNELFYGSLKDIYDELRCKGFVMPHRSFIVNYRFVRIFRPTALVMINDEVIPITRTYKEEIENIQIMLENGGNIM